MSTESTTPDIPDKQWTNPFVEGTPLHEQYDKIVRQHRDLIIIIDDYYARRGTGKTIASLQLAAGMDQTDAGVTFEKCSLQAEKIRNAYASQPKRSALVFDEGEVGASNREAMTKTNQALREIMSMGRVEEKYVIVNTPSIGFIDKDIQKLADVWISMVRKGRGLVHFLEREPYSEKLLRPKKQYIEFDDIDTGTDLRQVYNKLTKKKREKIKGEDGDTFVPADEHKKKLQKARKEARKEAREELIANFYTHPEVREAGIPQRVVGEAADVSQRTVSNIKERREGYSP